MKLKPTSALLLTAAIALIAAASYWAIKNSAVADATQPTEQPGKNVHKRKANPNNPNVGLPDESPVRLLTQSKDSKTRRQAFTAIMAHAEDLSEAEIDALFGFVVKGSANNDSAYAMAINEAINILQRQPKTVTALARVLPILASDQKQSPIIRDYAIQHIGKVMLKTDEKTKLEFMQVFTFFLFALETIKIQNLRHSWSH